MDALTPEQHKIRLHKIAAIEVHALLAEENEAEYEAAINTVMS